MIENYYEMKLHFKSAVTAEHQDRPVLTTFLSITAVKVVRLSLLQSDKAMFTL